MIIITAPESEFCQLVAGYGRVSAALLVCSETSGASKGYGVVR